MKENSFCLPPTLISHGCSLCCYLFCFFCSSQGWAGNSIKCLMRLKIVHFARLFFRQISCLIELRAWTLLVAQRRWRRGNEKGGLGFLRLLWAEWETRAGNVSQFFYASQQIKVVTISLPQFTWKQNGVQRTIKRKWLISALSPLPVKISSVFLDECFA